jgi:PIN domain nuclease of toxin-antitoxin system
MKHLLDTHVLVWWLEGSDRLTSQHTRIIDDAVAAGGTLHLSAIRLWEVTTLVSLGRVQLTRPLREWLEMASARPLVALAPLTPTAAAEVAALPDSFHRDPGDRIIVATARVLGATVLTCDRRIRESGLGHVV